MRENFNVFMDDFKTKFIEFFSSQCSSYDYALNIHDTKKVAEEILENLFLDKVNFSSSANTTIVQMKKDGVFIGFLLNKVFLYTLENYLLFFAKRELL